MRMCVRGPDFRTRELRVHSCMQMRTWPCGCACVSPAVRRTVGLSVNACVCAQMCRGPARPGRLCDAPPSPRGPARPAGLRAAGERGVDVPGRACPRALLLAQEHSHFPIPGKEHNVHWLLSCLVSPTPLSWAARRFLTRTGSMQGAKPRGQSGSETHRLQECQQREVFPG